jgi:4-amino-4-deoxy-L-arabinose transferase-like glycosyltransferase
MGALGAVARFAYVMAVSRHVALGADATWYYLEAGLLADGRGYVDPEAFFRTGASVATGNFPPLYPVVLAGWQTLLGGSETVSQLLGVPLGAITVVLAGVLGRRLAGARVGVVAAGLVALSPMLVAADGSMMSEALQVPLVLAAVLAAHVAGVDRRWWAWPVLGASIGLAALTRTEALLLVVLLVAPLAVWGGGARRERLLGCAASVLVVGVVLAPWLVRNRSEFAALAISTTSPATALAGANCEQTYHGRSIGSWEFACTHPERRATLGERAWGEGLRAEALDYARAHLGRLALVLPARELRAWGLWDPADLVRRDAEETRVEWFQWIVRVSGVVTLVAGSWGMWRLRGRGPGVLVLVAPVAMVAVTALVSHGNPRFRTVAEPELLVGCAVVAVAAADRVGRARGWRT